MARTGPTTKDTTTVTMGLAQIRVKASAAYIGQIAPILTASDSVGALANTKFTGTQEFYKLESGYPLLEDAVFPLREMASLECSFKEITPANMALAKGLDPTSYTNEHYGSIPLGTLTTPAYLRMEAVYTYPDGTNTLTIIFPRAQVIATPELDWQLEEPAAVPITIEAKRADSEISGGNVVWDAMPLGKMLWNDGSTLTSTTTTTSSTTTTTTP